MVFRAYVAKQRQAGAHCRQPCADAVLSNELTDCPSQIAQCFTTTHTLLARQFSDNWPTVFEDVLLKDIARIP